MKARIRIPFEALCQEPTKASTLFEGLSSENKTIIIDNDK
jgi:hypothetical protein